MPEFSSLLLSLLTASALSGLIGLEREMHIQNEEPDGSQFGGMRTYSMMGGLGFLGAYVALEISAPWLLFAVFSACTIFLFISHALVSVFQRQFGITSQLSLIASFLVGVLVAHEQLYLAIAVSILFTGLLVLKIGLHKIAKKINQDELLAILKFFILTAIILPILPYSWEDPIGFFDWRPQVIWLMVVLVASIRFVGYFLSKFFGSEKSILFSGIVGGFVSSTAVTMGISQQSEGKRRVIIFLVPILIASAIMFFRVLFEIIIVAPAQKELLLNVAPVLLVSSAGLIFLSVFLIVKRIREHKKNGDIKTTINIDQPLQMKSAIAFGLFFLSILLVAEKIAEFFPDSGLILASALAGLTDVDAITLAMANLHRTGEISADIASQAILMAVLVNTLVKVGIVFLFGSKPLFKAMAYSIAAIVLLGGVVFVVS
jgi:uncharacterized membrane protein (DUF4010 family)